MSRTSRIPAPRPTPVGIRTTRRALLGGAVAAAALTALPAGAGALSPAGPRGATHPGRAAGIRYGTFDHPFAPSSLWNSVPIDPVLGSYRIPDPGTGWYPQVDDGNYSIGVFKATAADPEQKILPLDGEAGVWDPDAEAELDSITLPHFPSSTLPPAGTDGSVAIHDMTDGRIWSFWQLRRADDGTWRAKQVSWGWQDGTGWGDPAHYFQGASASGSPNGAGLIRAAEYADTSAQMYQHALTMTLDHTALAPRNGTGEDGQVGFVFPATSGDGWGPQPTGKIPEGTRMLLPADFPVDEIPSREGRKVARTLQTYGAYVVDRNDGTPFTIGVQLGLDYEIADGHPADWDAYLATGVPQALDRIRHALAPITDVRGYLTAQDKLIDPEAGWGEDLLSMRGPWELVAGSEAGTYSTTEQRLEFSGPGVVQRRTGTWEHVSWAVLEPGERVRLTAEGGGDASLRLQIRRRGKTVVDTGDLRDGERKTITWPSGDLEVVWTARSGSSTSGSWIDGDLRRV